MDSYSKSIEGSSHKVLGLPCQDYSTSENFERGYIMTISDGHGSETYVRSHIGSKLACQIALRETKQFVLNNYDTLSNRGVISYGPDLGTKSEVLFTELFSLIHGQWYSAIKDDSLANPFSIAEQNKLGKADIKQAYGCTLIVAVKTKDFTFAYQLGDGRLFTISFCDEWKQPIPWDSYCEDNITTSLCDPSPVERFRYYLDSTTNQPYAIFICSDGIEDCYSGSHDGNFKSEGLIVDYEEVMRCYLQDEDFENACKDFLNYQSNKYSHDDMSIAFILDDRHGLQEKWLQLVEIRRKIYDIKLEYNNIKNKITIIDNRIVNIQGNIDNYNKELKRIQQQIINKQTDLDDSRQQKKEEQECVETGSRFNVKINEFKEAANKYRTDIEKCGGSYDSSMSQKYRRKLIDYIATIIRAIDSVLGLTRRDISNMRTNVSNLDKRITKLEDEINTLSKQKETVEKDKNAEVIKLDLLNEEKKQLELTLKNHLEGNEPNVSNWKLNISKIKELILQYLPAYSDKEETIINEFNSAKVLNICKKGLHANDEDVTIEYDKEQILIIHNGGSCTVISKIDFDNLVKRLGMIDNATYSDNVLTDNCIIIMEPTNDSRDVKYISLDQTVAIEIWEMCMDLMAK